MKNMNLAEKQRITNLQKMFDLKCCTKSDNYDAENYKQHRFVCRYIYMNFFYQNIQSDERNKFVTPMILGGIKPFNL